MSLVDTETGELIEPLDRAEAERLTTRIRLRLDTIADNYVAVMPLIREAIERRAFAALGYTGVSQYVSECFGDALAHLGVEVRREVVRELTAAGMSTRAIAPVVGVTRQMVSKDLAATQVATELPPPADDDRAPTLSPAHLAGIAAAEAEAAAAEALAAVIERADETFTTPEPTDECAIPAPRPVTGLDGKTYHRPAAPKPRRSPLTDTAREVGLDLRKVADRVARLAADDRFDANKDEVAAHLRGHLTHAAEVLADLLDRINN